jgi:hypothetical protein
VPGARSWAICDLPVVIFHFGPRSSVGPEKEELSVTAGTASAKGYVNLNEEA